jgi:hypothetical protein
MNNLTPVFERETGQVIIKGPPAGVAGEAFLVPVPGLELAFDRADGHLCRAVLETAGADGPIVVGEQEAAILTRLFGSHALSVVSGAPAWPREGPRGGLLDEAEAAVGRPVLSPEPGLTAMLSSLARLDATRVTSPVPPCSPWWAAEAADLAQRAGLDTRARAEAHQALAQLLRSPDNLHALPKQAVCAALAVVSISAASDPDAARRLREAIEGEIGEGMDTGIGTAIRPAAAPGPDAPPHGPGFDVAAEIQCLEKDRTRLTGLQWMLDPGLVPEGLFRPGLSPYSDLTVRPEAAPEREAGPDRVIVDAVLAPGADSRALDRCVARLVDPAVRRVLAQAAFTPTERDASAQVRAELRLKFPLYEVQDGWIEVVADKHRPVRSTKGHRIRRALRWADAALRAERAPAGMAGKSAREDWAALASLAWEQCRRDWEVAADEHRAALAAQREAALDSQASAPPPSGGPACLAEILGR